jgi:glycyl-tRNA synthetase beta chain
LLNEVLGLAEYPNVLQGSISSEFMGLPPEVLSTAMRVHQKYFSLIDENENLLPRFLFISNSLKEKNFLVRGSGANGEIPASFD